MYSACVVVSKLTSRRTGLYNTYSLQNIRQGRREVQYMQSLQQGKSVTNFLDKLDAGEVTGASGSALQPPKGFGSRTSEEARIWAD